MAQINWHQPATGLFRAVEMTHLIRSGALPVLGAVLDLGCGDGRFTDELRRSIGAAWVLVGVDRDPAEAEQARAAGIYARVHAVAADRIPEPDSSFDVVFSNSVLEHVDNLPEILAEAARLLKPGGRFVATVPSEEFRSMLGGPGWLGRFATGARTRRSYEDAIDRRVAHVNYWSLAEWERALLAVGLHIGRSSYYMDGPELRRWEWLSNLTAGVAMRCFGGATHPIEIQRQLGWRRSGGRSPFRHLGTSLVAMAVLGLRESDREEEAAAGGACLLLTATRLPGGPIS